MRNAIKYPLIAIVAVLVLLLAGAAILAATFDPNDYKPVLVRLVKEKTQRTLSIPGDIKLTFFPKIGMDLGRVALSERNSEADFASVDHAKVALALLPLLSKRVVVDRVAIDGLHASITRFKDGSTNFDDLLGKPQDGAAAATAPQARDAGNGTGGGAPLAFNIASVAVSNAGIVYDDRAQGRRIELRNVDLDTGKIAAGASGKLKLSAAIKASQPKVDATLSANSGYTIGAGYRQYALNGFEAEFKGSAATLDADLKIAGALTADLDKQQLNSPRLTLTLSGTQAGKALSGTLATPLAADLQAQHIALPNIDAGFTLPNPGGGTLKLKAAGNADLRLAQHTLAAVLKGSLDDSAFDARLGMRSFSPAAYTFDVGIDKLDLDRYRAKDRTKPAAASPAAAPASPPASSSQPAPAAGQPLDLSLLQDLQASGNVRIGALKIAGMQTSNVRIGVQAAGGTLHIDPLAASLYGGSTVGTITVTANPARFALRQTLSGIDIGPLLKDATGKQPIDGKGSVQLDVTSSGASVEQITNDLSGSARIALRNGAVHGIDIAQTMRGAKARLNALRGGEAPQSGTANAAEKTDFSELSASFRIAHGVAHNDDLDVKSPLLRIGGAGDIDLGAERVDYLARVTVVATLQGQGGPELQALKGLTVPVQLSGPFTAIGWHVDFAGIAKSLAKQKLDSKKEELKSKAQKALGTQKQQLQQQLQDKLKGLLGR